MEGRPDKSFTRRREVDERSSEVEPWADTTEKKRRQMKRSTSTTSARETEKTRINRITTSQMTTVGNRKREVRKPGCTGALPCTDASVLRTLAPLTCCGCSAAMLRVLCTLTPLPGCLVATLVHSLCVCDLCRVRVLVRLSHPRPPERNQSTSSCGLSRPYVLLCVLSHPSSTWSRLWPCRS